MPNDILITPASASIQFSGSSNASIRLQVDSSGSLNIIGNSGSLFSVEDNLSGSLMSVSDVSGIPILEVFSDDKVVMGTINKNTLVVTGSSVGIGTASPYPYKLYVSGSTNIAGFLSATTIAGINGYFDTLQCPAIGDPESAPVEVALSGNPLRLVLSDGFGDAIRIDNPTYNGGINLIFPVTVSGSFTTGQITSSLPVPSTTGLFWSTTHSLVGVKDNGVNRILKTRPNSESKVIVIAGSSVAYGVGASNYSSSWAGKLTTFMTNKGYTVKNASISGDTTQGVIDRFYKDIAPHNPQFVIHSTGLGNEGLDDSGYLTITETFRNNIHRLIRMTEDIGAIPILIGQYPKNTYGNISAKVVKDLYFYFEKYGVQCWDFFSALGDQYTGQYASSSFHTDGVHPSDVGHEAMFYSIPTTFFDVASKAQGTTTIPQATHAWKWGSNTSNIPFSITPENGMLSWTFGAWVRDGVVAGKAIMTIKRDGASGSPLRIRNPANVYYLTEDATDLITTSVSANSANWNHVVVTYNHLFNKVSLYLNGLFYGSSSLASNAHTASQFNLLGRYDNAVFNATGYSIAQPVLYRTPLSDEDIKLLYQGKVHRKSLEFYSPLDQYPDIYINNYADTKTYAISYQSGSYSVLNDASTYGWVDKIPFRNDLQVNNIYISGSTVGIGTNPTFQFQVNTSSSFVGPFINSGPIASSFYYDQSTGAYFHSPAMLIRCDSAENTGPTMPASLVLYNSNGGTNTGTKLAFANRESNGSTANSVAIAAITSQRESGVAGNWAQGNLKFLVKNGSSYTEAMHISSSGIISTYGDLTVGGNMIEKTVTFIPTIVGWYRVIVGSQFVGGMVRAIGEYDNIKTDIEFQFNMMAYSQGSQILMTRYGNYNSSLISAARCSSDGGGTCFLDVYVASATAPGPITLFFYGPKINGVLTTPTSASVAGSSDIATCIFGPGHHSSHGATFAQTSGKVGIGTTDPQYKVHIDPGSTGAALGLRVGIGSSTRGGIDLGQGTDTYPGYIQWISGSGARCAYMGYDYTKNLGLYLDNADCFIITGGTVGIGGAAATSTMLTIIGTGSETCLKVASVSKDTSTASNGRTFAGWLKINVDGTDQYIQYYT